MPPTENYRVPCRERQAREGFLEYRDSPQETKQENIFANLIAYCCSCYHYLLLFSLLLLCVIIIKNTTHREEWVLLQKQMWKKCMTYLETWENLACKQLFVVRKRKITAWVFGKKEKMDEMLKWGWKWGIRKQWWEKWCWKEPIKGQSKKSKGRMWIGNWYK